MKAFFQELKLKIQKWLLRQAPSSKNAHVAEAILAGKPSGEFQTWINVRSAEAILYRGVPYQISGDSIMHNGEGIFEKEIVGCVVTAIGGDNVDTLASRLESNIIAQKPKKLLLHDSGNSFLGMRTTGAPDYIFEKYMQSLRRIQAAGIELAIFEDIPLGPPETSVIPAVRDVADYFKKVNLVLMPQLMERIKAEGIKIIPVRDILQGPDGYIKPEYRMPDSIHCSEKAYRDCYLPRAKEFFAS